MSYSITKMIFILTISITSLISCTDSKKKEINKTKRSKPRNNIIIPSTNNFNEYFKFEKSILLDTNIILSGIWSMDSDTNENLLITDLVGKHVIQYDKNGKINNELVPEKCNPGFNWAPMNAKYFQKNIVVLNSGPWGYLFKKNGDCIGEMSSKFIAPIHYEPFKEDKIIGYYSGGKGKIIRVLDKKGDFIKGFGVFPKMYKKFIYSVDGGGIIVDENQNIYQVNVYSPEIIKYNSEGENITTFFRKPKNYNRISKDYFIDGFYRGIKQIKDKTLSLSLNLLNNSILLLELETNKKYEIELCTLDGNYLTSETLDVSGNVLLAKYNKLYILNKNEHITDDKYKNPMIDVYSFRY